MKLWGNSKELVTSIDILNTMNGGLVEPKLRFSRFDDHREIEVVVPGVQSENLKAEMLNNILSIYYLLEIDSGGIQLKIPRIVYSKAIPYFVDARRVSANFESDKMIVNLPFNDMARGHRRDITKDN